MFLRSTKHERSRNCVRDKGGILLRDEKDKAESPAEGNAQKQHIKTQNK